MRDNLARLSDGTIAGSVLKMNDAVKNMVEVIGVDFCRAIDYATINPARSLGVFNERGSIKEGKAADFTVLDKDFSVLSTIRGGEVIFSK